MSALSAVKAVLEADATLLTAATGGVWDYDETGRLGLSRELTPGAFDSNGNIKPCILVKSRSITPDYLLADDANKYVSAREMIELWLYQDTGYSSIQTMKSRIHALLHAVPLSGAFSCLWQGDIQPPRDTDLDASVERMEFEIRSKRST